MRAPYLYKNTLTPPPTQKAESWFEPVYRDSIDGLIRYPEESANIKIHDPRAFRSMSRASVLLSNVCLGLGEVIDPYLKRSPFSVGLYCAVENGPMDPESTVAVVNAPPEKFADVYRKAKNAKMYLKQLPNVVSAQLSIFLNVQGPMTVYLNSLYAVEQALIDAETDLRSGTVEAAVVCATHAFDDFLIVKRSRSEDPRPLAEGAAVLVIGREGIMRDRDLYHGERARIDRYPLAEMGDRYYGVAHELISLVNRIQ
jgi:hypothetical protein